MGIQIAVKKECEDGKKSKADNQIKSPAVTSIFNYHMGTSGTRCRAIFTLVKPASSLRPVQNYQNSRCCGYEGMKILLQVRSWLLQCPAHFRSLQLSFELL